MRSSISVEIHRTLTKDADGSFTLGGGADVLNSDSIFDEVSERVTLYRGETKRIFQG